MRSEEGSCQFSRLKYSEDLYQQIHWPASYDYLEQAGTQNAHRELLVVLSGWEITLDCTMMPLFSTTFSSAMAIWNIESDF